MKLNGATIPDAIVGRVIQRRGAEHSFADIDPARTALVVIDLQHAFMNDAVGFAAVGYTNCAPTPEARLLRSLSEQAAEQRKLLG